ncbi:phage tail protein [Escherichia coli]|uniref:tail fiber protein n=7 Tax=Escherichia coli TaxID=562 RepID=UPI000584B069|nr:tail fiber protein [Escherichia coli]EFE1121664.1 phage tail protein [Escherichia coli]EFF2242630.1 phage tail protein [Escherichia coli]EFM0605417.1 phage tail protein [Escherichia coli]EFM4817474.1 phage tail protein [Escherichia coli]EGI3903583.1 phage tail protein [Escherichia coli]
MDNEFYTLLTNRGMAKIASALADKKQLHLQKMAVGDGGGQYYEPTASQTKLRHEVWRGDLNTLTVAPNNPSWLIAELVLPENIGGWYIREVGVFDTDGELIAIGKFPESYKPLLPGGCGKQVCIRLIMEVSNTTAVTLTVDPSIVLATRDYVDSQLDEHEHSTNHPDATLTQKGFTQLSNATDSDDETKAATPKAVKAALIEARNHRHTWSQITDIPDGTLTQKGIVKLSNATNSNSTTEAATPSAVKAAYDLANSKAAGSHTHPWGQITSIPDGTLTQKGIVKLNNATNSNSTTEAATPSAVKAAYDLANSKAAGNHTHPWGQITGVPDGTLSQKGIVKLNNATDSNSTTEAATPSAVKAAYDKACEAYSRINNSSFRFYTSNGTFTVPAGVTEILLEMSGGGGGGGGGAVAGSSTMLNPKFGLGGGAGKPGELIIASLTVKPGDMYSFTVGSGGAGGAGGTQVIPERGPGWIPEDAMGQAGIPGGASHFSSQSASGGAGGGGGKIITIDSPHANSVGEVPKTYSSNGETAVNTPYGKGGLGGANSDGQSGSGYGAGGGGGAGLGSTWVNHVARNGGRGLGGYIKILW